MPMGMESHLQSMASHPQDLHFEMSDLLEEDPDDKASMDIDAADSPKPEHERKPGAGSIPSTREPVMSYEGRYHYDPHFPWSKQAERRVRRKIDLRICSFMGLMFFALQADRGAISHTLSTDMMEDFNITADQYHTGQTVYFLSLLLAELPSQLIGKHLGSEVWIPLQLIAWSLAVGAQVGVDGPWSFWVTRCLIGVFEGGFVPSCVLYLSYFYTSTELPLRLSWFWASYRFTTMMSGITTYGILHVSGLSEMPGWGWLSETEGALSFLVGCFAWLYLPPSPTRTASKFRGENGWFSFTEEKIMVNRVLRDDPSKGDMHHRQALTLKQLWHSICDYHMLPIYLIGLSWHISIFPASQYFTQNLLASGLGDLEIVLKAVPTDILWIFNILVLTLATELFNERLLLSIFSQIWVMPELVALTYLHIALEIKDTYHLTMLTCAQPFIHAILLGLVSRNSGSIRTRTVSTAVYSMCVQASTLIGAYIYQTDERPFYFRGNMIFVMVTAYNMLLFVVVKWFYWYCNQCREFRWENMSKHERRAYLANSKDEGNKRLDFRFKH